MHLKWGIDIAWICGNRNCHSWSRRQSHNPNTSNTGAMGVTPFEASNSTEALRQDFGLKKDQIDIIGWHVGWPGTISLQHPSGWILPPWGASLNEVEQVNKTLQRLVTRHLLLSRTFSWCSHWSFRSEEILILSPPQNILAPPRRLQVALGGDWNWLPPQSFWMSRSSEAQEILRHMEAEYSSWLSSPTIA